MSSRVVGIDLGTTHTVVAWTERGHPGPPEVFAIPQLVSRSEMEELPLLASCLYAPAEDEAVSDPWGQAPWVAGAFARKRGAEVPSRLVGSAKSWLSHGGVDRTAAILPWGAEEPSLPRLSPVEASARLLTHVRVTYNRKYPKHPLEKQQVVLTVPASFDPVARQLTLDAARAAGLSVRLLEEPQAAFYDSLQRFGQEPLRALVADRPHALVLVCDVGGGTTDLTLIRVARTESDAVDLTRAAVGRHLLLGGDNMDLALAHTCEPRLVPEGRHLEPQRFAELVLLCRAAKERLLSDETAIEHPINLISQGSSLVGNTLATRLSRDEVIRVVLDGFFPETPLDTQPKRGRSGFLGFGLPYESDPGVTRHIAAFVQRHAPAQSPIEALLLNGGLFHAPRIVDRVENVVRSWLGRPLKILPLADPDLAVARGAVVFGLAASGIGLRIGGGSAHGYYVGVEGDGHRRRALCVVPRGSKEGERHLAAGHVLGLKTGEPVRFELYASDESSVHAPGQLVDLGDEHELLPPVATRFESDGPEDADVRVELEGELSAVGTLEIACVEVAGSGRRRRFELAFELRGQEPGLGKNRSTSERPRSGLRAAGRRWNEATEVLQRLFGKGRTDVTPREVKNVVRELERLLGERRSWDVELARALFDIVGPKYRARQRSADHERLFWMLSGYCLRPGFGHPLDPGRVAILAPLFAQGLTFDEQARGWQQFWIAWRRIAGGLDQERQGRIRDRLDPFLAPPEAGLKKPKGFRPEAHPELLELASWLERVPAGRRTELGNWVIERTWTKRDAGLWTALGRIGARSPVYASAHHVVPPRVAERWLDHMLTERWEEIPSIPYAAAHLARLTGDRVRDLGEPIRQRVAERLEQVGARPQWARWVRELVEVEEADRAEVFGEELPVGLRLLGPTNES